MSEKQTNAYNRAVQQKLELGLVVGCAADTQLVKYELIVLVQIMDGPKRAH